MGASVVLCGQDSNLCAPDPKSGRDTRNPPHTALRGLDSNQRDPVSGTGWDARNPPRIESE
jgi:hypothetical protein